MTANSAPDVQELSYEAARDELIAVVQKLESGGAGLEESLQLWERGEALAKRCEDWLIGAKARLEKARAAANSAAEQASDELDGEVF